jgi:hypothetical protein
MVDPTKPLFTDTENVTDELPLTWARRLAGNRPAPVFTPEPGTETLLLVGEIVAEPAGDTEGVTSTLPVNPAAGVTVAVNVPGMLKIRLEGGVTDTENGSTELTVKGTATVAPPPLIVTTTCPDDAVCDAFNWKATGPLAVSVVDPCATAWMPGGAVADTDTEPANGWL